MTQATVIAGTPLIAEGELFYEQTSALDEVVRGRLLMAGTADTQLKLTSASTDIALYVGISQSTGSPGYDTSVTPPLPDTAKARNGEPIRAAWGKMLVELDCAQSQTIVKGDALMADALGRVQKWTTGNPIVGRAHDALTTTSAELPIQAWVDLPVVGGVA